MECQHLKLLLWLEASLDNILKCLNIFLHFFYQFHPILDITPGGSQGIPEEPSLSPLFPGPLQHLSQAAFLEVDMLYSDDDSMKHPMRAKFRANLTPVSGSWDVKNTSDMFRAYVFKE